MKKKIAVLAMLVGVAATLTACGGDKYVTTLGAYKGVEVTVEPKQAIEDTDIQSYIDRVLSAKTTYEEVDREVENGDQVNIDYVGKIDGEAFDGGSSSEGGYNLTIGSHSFIDGFEEGLIGSKKGDTLDLDLTFPETYKSTELAGKDVVFTVTVNTVSEAVTPELTDDFVVSLAQDDCKTVDEYKAYVKNMLEEQAQYTFDQAVQDAAFDVVFKESVVADPAQKLIDSYYNKAVSQADQYASYYGTDRDTFVTQSLGMTVEEFDTQAKEQAVTSAKKDLVMNAIAKKEKIKVKKDEINQFAQENMSYYGYSTADELISSMGEDEITQYLKFQKVFELIGTNAVVTEQEGASETTTEEASTEEVTEEGTTEAVAEETTEATTETATEETATEEAAE